MCGRNPKKMVEGMLEKIRENPPPRIPFTVTWSWDDVQHVVAYKMDFWSYDQIRLRFEFAAAPEIEICEEAPGFVDLMEQMKRSLPLTQEDWYWRVMEPAFEANVAVLFTRDANQ